LIEIVRSQPGDATDVAARNPTIAEALATPRSRTYRLLDFDPDYPTYSEDDVINFGHAVPELEALMRQAMVIRDQFRWAPASQQVVEVGRVQDDDMVVLLYPRNEQVAAFIRRCESSPCAPERRSAPAAVEAPAADLAPVEVRRRFTVMPSLEALAVYRGELVFANADLVRNAAVSWSTMTADDIERKTGIVERRESGLGLDDMALRVARAPPVQAGRGARRRPGQGGTEASRRRGRDRVHLHEPPLHAVDGDLAVGTARHSTDARLLRSGGRLCRPAVRRRGSRAVAAGGEASGARGDRREV